MLYKKPIQDAQPVATVKANNSLYAKRGTFIDLFSGCGGTSLGFMQAGWQGLFGIEKEGMAFDTLSYNLIKERTCKVGFKWPSWLPVAPISLHSIMNKYKTNLHELRGKIDLVSGSPPCQGFSMAGRRNRNDWRNHLWKEYVNFIKIVQPRLIFMESVKGFSHRYTGKNGRKLKPFSNSLIERLEADYQIDHIIVPCQLFGLPQKRDRFFMIGVRRTHVICGMPKKWAHFGSEAVKIFRSQKGLSNSKDITTGDALGDLETKGCKLIPCADAPRRMQIAYRPPKVLGPYLQLLRKNDEVPNSMRLAKHGDSVTMQFKAILDNGQPGETAARKVSSALGNKKRTRILLDKNMPSCTIMTLPDDVIHYSEPRILTVRECARLQSFPDAFSFRGQYTTGSVCRRHECPRYTQVGNAVPPLVAEFWGDHLAMILDTVKADEGQLA